MVVYSCEGGYREGPDYWRDPDWKRWLPVCVCVRACVRVRACVWARVNM